MERDDRLLEALRASAHGLDGSPGEWEPLLDRIGGARVVLLGEATHGSHEFYDARLRLTQRLVADAGFSGVAIEGDWPDAWRVHRYVTGVGEDDAAVDALGGFDRFPRWMWRNRVALDLVGWLRAHDERPPPGARRVGFYGLDLYAMHASIEAVVRYLDGVDRAAADAARARYGCFDPWMHEAEAYGWSATRDASLSCEREAVAQLVAMRGRMLAQAGRDEPELFSAAMNAQLVQDAERYYREMYRGSVASWNLRDRHMADVLDLLLAHLRRRDGEARLVVWAHDSHVGDARATELADEGETSLGTIVRERYGGDAVSVGFTTYEGTVTAASTWDAPERIWRVRPGLPGSWEDVLHRARPGDWYVVPRAGSALRDAMSEPRLERAIGVVYRPDTERASHYVASRIGERYDAIVHFDRTTAVEPIDARPAPRPSDEPPETWPMGL